MIDKVKRNGESGGTNKRLCYWNYLVVVGNVFNMVVKERQNLLITVI